MTRTSAPGEHIAAALDSSLADLVERLTTRMEAGEALDAEAVAAEHPQFADELRRLLPALQALAELEHSAGAQIDAGGRDDPLGLLGDYRIVREVGRGGMGVVYEAVQVSLGRRVALKVLPLAAALDPRHLQRFKVEAQAAAQLRHTSIVPVYGVGCERGVHFYAMQFIDGPTLAAVIDDLGRRRGDAGGTGALAPTGPFGPPAPADQAATDPLAGFSTEHSGSEPAYFRTVADLGRQAAEALEHAHQQGVTHRDIKPANLMVDARAHLWVTDFGLAHCQQGPGLTMTGDLVGTLRYMSPEQALGQRGGTDHRTDVYSLGATLYELLAFEPAFDGPDRQTLLRQIAFDAPRPPRRLNPAAPYELETIVLKAMAKAPEDRYATAQEFADDLRRFLEDRPVLARRPTLLRRLSLWARRHRRVVVPTLLAAFAVLLVSVTALAISLRGIREALDERTTALGAANEARGDLEKALGDLREQQRQRERALGYHCVALADRELQANFVDRAEEALDECPAEWRSWEWHYLRRLCHNELSAVAVADWLGNRIAFDARGAAALIPFQRGGRLWSLSTDGEAPRLVRVFDAAPRGQGGLKSVSMVGRYGCALSPDGKLVALMNSSSPLSVRDAATGTEVFALPAVSTPAPGRDALLAAQGHSPVAFSPDGKLVASGGSGFLFVCDVATGKLLLRRIQRGESVWSVALSPDGRWVAIVTGLPTGNASARLDLLDLATNGRTSLKGHTGSLRALAFSPDGKYLAAGGEDRVVRLWSLNPPPREGDREQVVCQGHGSNVACVCFSPDGQHLATAGGDRTVRVWEAATGKELLTLRGHVGPVHSLTWSGDGRRLISVGHDRMLRVWDARASRAPWAALAHQGNIPLLCFSQDGTRLLTADLLETKVWDTATYEGPAVTPTGEAVPLAGTVTPEGRCLVLSRARPGARDKDVVLTLTDAARGAEVSRMTVTPLQVCAALSPDGKRFAVAPSVATREPATVRVHEVQAPGMGSGREVAALAAGRTVSVVTFSPDGSRLAAGVGNTVRVWDLATGEVACTLEGHRYPVSTLAFEPGGNRLASASAPRNGAAGELKLWDLAAGKEVVGMRGHSGAITVLAFRPDGKRLASAGQDRSLKLWDPATGREVLALRDTAGLITSLAFTPDGQRLVSGDVRGTLTIRDGSPSGDRPRISPPPPPEDGPPSDP